MARNPEQNSFENRHGMDFFLNILAIKGFFLDSIGIFPIISGNENIVMPARRKEHKRR